MRSRRATRHVRRLSSRLLLECLEDRVNPGFLVPSQFDVGIEPVSVAIGDFNGDGIPDLAVPNSAVDGGVPSVSILLGNGDGTFQQARNFAAGSRPYSVAVGDFNGDGIPDLAVANNAIFGGTSSVSVLLGNGDGTFQPPLILTAGSNPTSVAVGDFNGDGLLDIVAANENSENVSVLLGKGNGTFQAARNFNAGIFPDFVQIGDFNGDGISDLAVANAGQTVSILLGNGDGSFQPARNIPAGPQPDSLAIADFNGDGIPDLVVSNFGDGDPINVFLGNGDGTFGLPRTFTDSAGPRFVATADMNSDGILDLVVANNDDTVSLFPGLGDGTFGPGSSFSAGSNAVSVAVDDINGDGIPDIAVTDRYGNSVSILIGAGAGRFGSVPYTSVGIEPVSVTVGDFNGDGIPDLAVTNDVESGGNSTVSIMLGNGDGTFQPPLDFQTGLTSIALAVGDYNGDGIPDIVVANSARFGGSPTISLLLGNGDGTFQPARNFSDGSTPSYSLAVGDFNGDGNLDLAVGNYGTDHVSVLLGNGDGTFQAPQSYFTGSDPYSVAIGDFNGDGIPDLIVADYGCNDVRVLFGRGDGTFTIGNSYAAGSSPVSVVVGDFNGDGIPDLGVADSGYRGTPALSILLGNGNGTFQPARNFYAGSGIGSLAVGDFNGDGIPDLVAVGTGVRVFVGDGDGTFRSTNLSYITRSQPGSLAVGDFNGDGRSDLAVTDPSTNDVSILLNDGIWSPPRPGGRPGGGSSESYNPGAKTRALPIYPDAGLRDRLASVPVPIGAMQPSPVSPRASFSCWEMPASNTIEQNITSDMSVAARSDSRSEFASPLRLAELISRPDWRGAARRSFDDSGLAIAPGPVFRDADALETVTKMSQI